MSVATAVRQLTPIGRGAIASLCVQGPQATSFVAKRFSPLRKRDPDGFTMGRIRVGIWCCDERHVGEELVVCRTDHDRYEIHCHGGRAAIASIVDSLVDLGCEHSTGQEVTRGMTGHAWKHQALTALAAATTQRTALILLDQHQGAFCQAIGQVSEAFESGRHDAARSQLQSLLAWTQFGLHLVIPWKVVIAGPPNVGKSSLINSLLGYQRAVVFSRPGTTRDVVAVETAVDGWPVTLHDTAGLRESDDPIETEGVQRALASCRDSDLIVWVQSIDQPLTAAELRTREALDASLIVVNKADLADTVNTAMADVILTSALTGAGIGRLVEAISQSLVPAPPAAGAPVPYCEQQAESLEAAIAAIDAGNLASAGELLSSLRA